MSAWENLLEDDGSIDSLFILAGCKTWGDVRSLQADKPEEYEQVLRVALDFNCWSGIFDPVSVMHAFDNDIKPLFGGDIITITTDDLKAML